MADDHFVFDTFNESILSDLRNDIDSARRMPSNDQKEKLLTDI